MDTRPASYVVAQRDGAVLLAHWNEGGRTGWTLPGGGMEGRESTEETAIREFREETGYEVALDGLLGVDTYYVDGVDRLVPGAGDLTHEVDGTTDECRWVPLAEVAELDTVSLVDVALEMLAGP